MPRLTPQESPDKRPVASWSTGKERLDSDRTFRGWFIDVGLDDRLDAAGWEQGTLGHLGGKTGLHWLLPAPCPLYILIQGIPYTTMSALVKTDVSYSGLKACWPPEGRSVLGFQALHPDLLAAGYQEPIPFSVKSTSTDDLLAALLKHHAILDACEAAASRKGTPRTFEFPTRRRPGSPRRFGSVSRARDGWPPARRPCSTGGSWPGRFRRPAR
ncbi:MAG TPA: hypothetical protein VFZ66_23000 [Herpetosiphonaceae bacterium]